MMKSGNSDKQINCEINAQYIDTVQNANTINIHLENSSENISLIQNAAIIQNVYAHEGSAHKIFSLEELENFRNRVREFYKNNATIKIPVFDTPQHVTDSHINVAIVDNETQNQIIKNELEHHLPLGRTGTLENDNVNLLGRNQTYEDINPVKDQVPIESIFDNSDRALMIGRAGIGKSTFCKYIAYKWQDKNENNEHYLWPQFKMIYWIPLRFLALYRFRHNTNLAKEFSGFIERTLPKLNVNSVDEQFTPLFTEDEIFIQLQQEKDSTLFILDGYDEIKEYLQGKSQAQQQAKELFHYMCSFKNFIITSRPHAIDKNTFDHLSSISRYELMGFTHQDIPAYITKTLTLLKKSETEIKEAIGVIRKNPCIFGVAHIPVNLALICSVWNKSFVNHIEDINMTELYTKLIMRIYKINFSKLWNQGDNAYQEKIDKILDEDNGIDFKQFLDECKPLINFLEELAFEGMQNNQLIFSQEQVEKLLPESKYNEFYNLAEKLDLPSPLKNDGQGPKPSRIRSIMRFICKLGFLATLPHDENRHYYYFIHLTFQEYFAASYLNNLWICETTQHNAINILNPMVENPRFEVLIWFLAGHLYRENGIDHHINTLFDTIKSHAITGIVNKPLITFLLCRCLEEAYVNNINIKDEIILALKLLLERILFHSEMTAYKHLNHYRKIFIDALKFSPHVLKILNIEHSLKELVSSSSSPKWSAVVYTQLFTSDAISELTLIINNKNKRLNARKAALEKLIALIDTHHEEESNIISIIIEYLLSEEDELFKIAWNGLVYHNQHKQPSVTDKLNRNLELIISESRSLMILDEITKNGYFSKYVLAQCFHNTDQKFELISDQALLKYQEQFIGYCREILTEEDLLFYRDSVAEENILFNGLCRLKAAWFLEKFNLLEMDNFDFWIDNKDCNNFIYSKITRLSLVYKEQYNTTVNLLKKIINYSIAHDEDMDIEILVYYSAFDGWQQDHVIKGLILLFNNNSISNTLLKYVEKEDLHKSPLISEAYNAYKERNLDKKNKNSTFNLPSNPEHNFPYVILDELYSNDLCRNAKAKLEDKLYQPFYKEIIYIVENEIKKNEHSDLHSNQVFIEILVENNKHEDFVIQKLIANDERYQSTLNSDLVLVFIKKHLKNEAFKNVLFSTYIDNISSKKEQIALHSLSSLIILANTLPDSVLDNLDTLLEDKKDDLENYNELRIKLNVLFHKKGSFNRNKTFRSLKSQLNHVDPSVRLSACQNFINSDREKNLLPIIDNVLLLLVQSADDVIRDCTVDLIHQHGQNLMRENNTVWFNYINTCLNDSNPKIAKSAFKVFTVLITNDICIKSKHLWEYHRLWAVNAPLPVSIVEYLQLLYTSHRDANNLLTNEFFFISALMRKLNKIDDNQFFIDIRFVFFEEHKRFADFFLDKIHEIGLSDDKLLTFILHNLSRSSFMVNNQLHSKINAILNKDYTKRNSSQLTAILSNLCSKISWVREISISLLFKFNQSVYINDEHARIIYQVFNSNHFPIICNIIRWTNMLDGIPKVLIAPITQCLYHRHASIRQEVQILFHQHQLYDTDECSNTLLTAIFNHDSRIADLSYNILVKNKHSIKIGIRQIDLLGNLLESRHSSNVHKLIYWLKEFKTLNPYIMAIMQKSLAHPHHKTRIAAYEILNHFKLMDKPATVETIGKMLCSDNFFIRKFSLQLITTYVSLRPFSLKDYLPIINLLNTQYHDDIFTLLRWMLSLNHIPKELYKSLSLCLSSNDVDVRNNAEAIFRKHDLLATTDALDGMLLMLSSNHLETQAHGIQLSKSIYAESLSIQSLNLISRILFSGHHESKVAILTWLFRFESCPKELIPTLVNLLSHLQMEITTLALNILSKNMPLLINCPEHIIAGKIIYGVKSTRRHIIHLLCNFSDYSKDNDKEWLKNILIYCIDQLFNDNPKIRKNSLNTIFSLNQKFQFNSSLIFSEFVKKFFDSEYLRIIHFIAYAHPLLYGNYYYWHCWQILNILSSIQQPDQKRCDELSKINNLCLNPIPNFKNHYADIIMKSVGNWQDYAQNNLLRFSDLLVYVRNLILTFQDKYNIVSNDPYSPKALVDINNVTLTRAFLKKISNHFIQKLGEPPCPFYIIWIPNNPMEYAIIYFQDESNRFKMLQTQDYFLMLAHTLDENIAAHLQDQKVIKHYIYNGKVDLVPFDHSQRIYYVTSRGLSKTFIKSVKRHIRYNRSIDFSTDIRTQDEDIDNLDDIEMKYSDVYFVLHKDKLTRHLQMKWNLLNLIKDPKYLDQYVNRDFTWKLLSLIPIREKSEVQRSIIYPQKIEHKATVKPFFIKHNQQKFNVPSQNNINTQMSDKKIAFYKKPKRKRIKPPKYDHEDIPQSPYLWNFFTVNFISRHRKFLQLEVKRALFSK